MYRPLRASIPPAAAWLGYGGLLPFVFLALGILIDNQRATLFSAALIAYDLLPVNSTTPR